MTEQAQAQLGLSGDVILSSVEWTNQRFGRPSPLGRDPQDRRDLALVVSGGRQRRRDAARPALVIDLESRTGQFRGSVLSGAQDVYNAATVLVIPSHYESFGLAAVEALACARVIGSMVGGSSDDYSRWS